MMDLGPENKRPRLQSWNSEARQLPPPTSQAPSNYPLHQSPFSRPPEPPNLLDRRPSEHSPYDHQERRPNSGPSHAYGHPPPPPPPPPLSQAAASTGGYPRPPQEPMVKRDPSDEPPPQLYRPPSGNGLEHNVNPNIPPPHHEGAGRPYLPSFEPRPQYPPPTSYQPQPSPTPMSATESYNHPYGTTGLPTPRDPVYTSVSYPTPTQRQQPDVRKKAQRAAQACDSCRTLKAKCDEGRPSCTSCKEKGIDCRYRDPPPKQQDKVSADIMEYLQRMEASLFQRFAMLDGQVAELSKTIKQPLIHASPKQEIDERVQMPLASYGRHSIGSESHHLQSMDSPYSSTTPGLQTLLDMPDPIRPGAGDASEEDEDNADPGPPKAPSIPVNHTTGAARLLLVGPIAEMVKEYLTTRRLKAIKYPIHQEQRRGILSLYGRGEGYDDLPGYDRDPLKDYGETPGDTPSNVSSPAAVDWGQIGGLTPPSNSPPDIPRATISIEGMPDLSTSTVWELVRSYNDNMNIMHPLLIPSALKMLVERFLRDLPESNAKPLQVQSIREGHRSHPPPGFLGGPGSSATHPESPGNKRKRSPASGSDYPDVLYVPNLKPGHPDRSICSALVLLVLALGKICQHRGKIPGPVPDKERSHSSSPVIRNGHPPSPLQSSPSMSTSGMASPQDFDSRSYPRSRRASLEGGIAARSTSGLRQKNLDVIPGLAYFALATDVLGNQMAGNTLQHVHAMVLAGLYHGQLGRVMESHGYIAAGCRSLQVILRPSLEKFRKAKMAGQIANPKDNQLLFAFWTCLQLESDIVAELPCPHSGILTYEEDMPAPNYTAAVQAGFNKIVIESYSAQLFLRKHLNQLHNMFYKPEGEDSQFPKVVVPKPSDHFPTIEACQENLNTIARWAPNFTWDADKGEPANEILGARLRAKYYGAQVITYRHFVLKILGMSTQGGEKVTDEFKENISAPQVMSGAELSPKSMQFARNAIKALIYSTRAFHGLGEPGRDRIIVTNIWGTAHAQWGNMLTLSAAYDNPILSKLVLEFVSKEQLQDLLHKTMAFLALTAAPTSALAIDYRLLQIVGQKTGLIDSGPNGPVTTASFSSTSTGDPHMAGH